MRFLNYCNGVKSIKVLYIIDSDEFVNNSIVANLINLLPPSLKNSVSVCTPSEGDTIDDVTNVINKLNQNAIVSIGELDLYKYYSHRKTVPKTVGLIEKGKDVILNRHVQYYKFAADSLYLQAALIHKEKCFRNLIYLVENKKVLSTALPRRLITPSTQQEVKKAFKFLLKQKLLGADIEATSLKFYKAKLVSISFAISETDGFTFHVKKVKFLKQLKRFFELYQGKLVWHNGAYDLKALAYMLFEGDSRPLFRTYEDTLFLHFICTNSPERFPRDLGTLISDLCGEYKLTKKQYENMMDVDTDLVCEYNLDDSRGTLWLYNQYRNRIHSEYLYAKMKEWQWYLTQTELTGLPIDRKQVEVVKKAFTMDKKAASDLLAKHPLVIKASVICREIKARKANAKTVSQKEVTDFPLSFNSKSPDQLSVLLYNVMGFECTNFTKKGKNSTSSKTIDKLRVMATEEQKEVFNLIIKIAEYSTMLGTFISALEESSFERDGHFWLHGNYNLAKAVSGRLTSSNPNLQNLPSSSTLSKMFKTCFVAPPNFTWGGADYASLEERINTILTKDPNKEAVYDLGYDGHSFRAYHYFLTELTDISKEIEKVNKYKTVYEVKRGDVFHYFDKVSLPKGEKFKKVTAVQAKVGLINNIEFNFGKLRKKSKNPTFLLQYLGTAYGLIQTCGFTPKEAKSIYENYYVLYKESAKWLDAQLRKVSEKGYAEVAFGLRIYSYGLANTILNARGTPKKISEFIRTLGNAIGGQSYGQLTVDAGAKFLRRVYKAGLQNDVLSSASIHDAIYIVWRDTPEITEWVNINLIECMMDTSEHPELNSSRITLPAKLEVHVLNWATPVALPNNIKAAEINQHLVTNYDYD